jgi:hypothetical protein
MSFAAPPHWLGAHRGQTLVRGPWSAALSVWTSADPPTCGKCIAPNRLRRRPNKAPARASSSALCVSWKLALPWKALDARRSPACIVGPKAVERPELRCIFPSREVMRRTVRELWPQVLKSHEKASEMIQNWLWTLDRKIYAAVVDGPCEPPPAGNRLLGRTARREPRSVAFPVVQRPSWIVCCDPLRWARHAFDFDGDEVLIPTRLTAECALVVPGIRGLDAGQRHWTTAIRTGGMRDK